MENPTPMKVSQLMEPLLEPESDDSDGEESVFDCVKPAPPFEMYVLNDAFKVDTDPRKLNLCIKTYRNPEGGPFTLPVVFRTGTVVVKDPSLNYEYLPCLGNSVFSKEATKLLLGENSNAWQEFRAFGIQGVSGTGSLRLGAEYLRRYMGREIFYYSNPTWENHHKIFSDAGFKTAMQYRYWDAEKRDIDIPGMLEDLEQAPEDAVIILHACAHNPTGIDPSHEEWMAIADVIKRKNLFPFFDVAYQGFATGDPDRDAWAVRYFADCRIPMFCAQTFAKCFGLYSERVGNLTIVQAENENKAIMRSQFSLIIRGSYSNPPSFGTRIVATILKEPHLRKEWMECINIISSRNNEMRRALRDILIKQKTPGNWDFLLRQIGMFNVTGLNEEQTQILLNEYHIYILKNGRINMSALNSSNLAYVAGAMHDAITRN